MSSQKTSPAWDATPKPKARPTMVNAPSPAVVAYLLRAREVEVGQYVRNGGGRDFKHEQTQDDAKEWLQMVEAWNV